MKPQRCVLFAGDSSRKLGQAITDIYHNEIIMGNIYSHTFPSGEKYCQLRENIRGDDVFLLQAICSPANDNLMQLLVMADACRRASAARITAVLPMFGYQRQDRKDKPRVPISAKLVANLLVASGVNRILTMDLHAQQIQGFFDIPVDHLYFRPSLMTALEGLDIQTVVAPDMGGIKKAMDFATKCHLEFAFVVKQRNSDTEVEAVRFVGDVKNKNILLLDDLTESMGTLCAAAMECKKNGAANIYAAVTHGCLTQMGTTILVNALFSGLIKQFFCSNTVTETTLPPWTGATIVDVADVFATAITKIHDNESVTELFQ